MAFAFSGIVVRYCSPREASAETLKNETPSGMPLEASAESPGKEVSSGTPRASGEEATSGTSEAPDSGDELHVNLWEVAEKSILDLGIMININGDKKVCAIQVDLPWKVEPRNITDLGAQLNSEKTVAAIFNEIVHYNGRADNNYATIRLLPSEAPNVRDFALLRLNSNSYKARCQHLADGSSFTQLRVELPSASEMNGMGTSMVYVRFRIKDVPPEVYASIFRQKDRNLLSSSTETRIVDFRINVRRGVPDEILSSADRSVWFPPFKKIHFFLTIDRAQTCDFESKSFKGCRSLYDESIWSEYIGGHSAVRGMIGSMRNYLGYQWTASVVGKDPASNRHSSGVKDLVVLGRFSRHQSSFLLIGRFIFLGLLFGMVGNALWDIIKPHIHTADHIETLKSQSGELLVVIGVLFLSVLLATPPITWARNLVARLLEVPHTK